MSATFVDAPADGAQVLAALANCVGDLVTGRGLGVHGLDDEVVHDRVGVALYSYGSDQSNHDRQLLCHEDPHCHAASLPPELPFDLTTPSATDRIMVTRHGGPHPPPTATADRRHTLNHQEVGAA